MGCDMSALEGEKFIPRSDGSVRGQSVAVISLCEELGYTENDVHRLWRHFIKSDLTSNGVLCIREFMMMHQIFNRSFGKLVFAIFDYDSSGDITFEEFCIAAWNTFTLDDTNLPTFSFRLFDKDNSGYLSATELYKMLKIVCGKNEKSIEAANKFIQENDHNKDGLISCHEFIAITKRTQLIMFPAFQMRDHFRKEILGYRRWEQLTAQRNKIYPNMFLAEIIAEMTHKPEGYRGVNVRVDGACYQLASQKLLSFPVERMKKGRNGNGKGADQQGGQTLSPNTVVGGKQLNTTGTTATAAIAAATATQQNQQNQPAATKKLAPGKKEESKSATTGAGAARVSPTAGSKTPEYNTTPVGSVPGSPRRGAAANRASLENAPNGTGGGGGSGGGGSGGGGRFNTKQSDKVGRAKRLTLEHKEVLVPTSTSATTTTATMTEEGIASSNNNNNNNNSSNKTDKSSHRGRQLPMAKIQSITAIQIKKNAQDGRRISASEKRPEYDVTAEGGLGGGGSRQDGSRPRLNSVPLVLPPQSGAMSEVTYK